MATLTPQAFAEKWAGSALSERASYQQHFLDLCAMLGAPALAEVDPTGEFFTFEKGVEKTGGGKGFADVWYAAYSQVVQQPVGELRHGEDEDQVEEQLQSRDPLLASVPGSQQSSVI